MRPLTLAVVLALLAFSPAAAVVAPVWLAPHASDDARTGPPLFAPNGYGAFPAEGALGTHGCPFPARVADVLAGRFAAGSAVCVETARVVQAATFAGDGGRDRGGEFTLEAPDGARLRARVSEHWWMHGTPALGMLVVVEGEVAGDAARGFSIEPVARWVDLTHPGRTVPAWHVAAGLVPENEYVWVERASVIAVWRNNDGPNDIGDNHVETGTLCPMAHLTTETTPPYFGIVPAPPVGATIRLFGAARYDNGHGWWEIHPIRAWEALPSEQAAKDCPDRVGESGWPPPGIVPDRIPPLAQAAAAG